MKLDVESLRALRLVVETGGFTEAAERLGVTQSAVSWKIKRLEERVGVDLVKRGQEVEATPDGRDLLVYAERILTAHDEAVAHLTRSDIEGVVRLGSNEDLPSTNLAEVLGRFGRAFPNVRLETRMALSGTVADWLDEGEVDMALIQIPASGPNAPRPDDVLLWTDPLHWVQGADVEFPRREVVPHLSYGAGCAYLDEVEEAFGAAGLRWRTALECPTLAGMQGAVRAGLGVAVMHERSIPDDVIEWTDAPRSARLPHLSHVIRTASHGDQDLLELLRNELIQALEES